MFKHIIVALIAFNSMHMFDANRRLDESLVRQYMSMDASIYADIRSRHNGTDSRPQNNSTDQIEDNVRQLRQYFSGGVLQAPTYQCQYMVSYFGLILFEFIKCILINEIPGNICLGCAQQYTDLIQAYADLTNETVSNCTLGFINKDKANLIHSLYSNGIYQWKDGDCDNCFGGKDEYQNLVVHNDTQYYFQLTEDHMNCLQSANSSHNQSCIECKTSYHVINDYYDLLAENYTNDVCNDIIASLKDVRKLWSETLNCRTDFKSNLYLLLSVLAVALLPIVLYLTGRMFCVDKNKTLMKQKRLSSYHLGSSESEPLMQRSN